MLVNAGKTKAKGVELELASALTERITAGFGYSYNDAKFREYDNSDQAALFGDPSAKGNQTPNASKHQMNLFGRYEFPLGNGMTGFLRGRLCLQLEEVRTDPQLGPHRRAKSAQPEGRPARGGLDAGPVPGQCHGRPGAFHLGALCGFRQHPAPGRQQAHLGIPKGLLLSVAPQAASGVESLLQLLGSFQKMRRRAFVSSALAASAGAFWARRSRAEQRVWDCIIVGAGTAGLPAAIFAARRGAQVLLIDPYDKIGGNLHRANGQIAAAGSRLQTQRNIADSPDIHYEDVMRISRNLADPDIIRSTVDNAADTINWLLDGGLKPLPGHPVTGAGPGRPGYSVPRYLWAKEEGRAILRVVLGDLAPPSCRRARRHSAEHARHGAAGYGWRCPGGGCARRPTVGG